MKSALGFLSLVCLLVGCGRIAPPEPLDLLAQTAGAPVIADADGRVRTSLFSVDAPHGWRTITSSAIDPLTLTFAAPDNCALMIVSTTPITLPELPCEADEFTTRETTITTNDTPLYIAGIIAQPQADSFQPLFETLVDSIENE